MTIKEEMNFLVSNKTSRLNFLKEDTSQEEHNMEEIGSVKSNLLALCHNSEDIIELIRDGKIQTAKGIDAWVVEKIAVANKDIHDVLEFLQYSGKKDNKKE